MTEHGIMAKDVESQQRRAFEKEGEEDGEPRPVRSEIQPKAGRVRPPVIRSRIKANGRLQVQNRIVTVSAMPKSMAIGSYPIMSSSGTAPTVIIRQRIQKVGVRIISSACSRAV